MGALRLGRGLGRGVRATRAVSVRAHDWQPDHHSHYHEPHAELDDPRLWATGGSSTSSQLGRDDEVAALAARVAALEEVIGRVSKVADTALALVHVSAHAPPAGADATAASASATAAARDDRPSPPALLAAESFPTERAHASSVTGMACGMPGAHEPPAVTRRRLPPAPSPGQHAHAPSGEAVAGADGVDGAAATGADGHSPLHWEIRRFVDANDELVRRQAQLRQYAIDLLAHDVRSAWPCAQLRLYGSLATGLCSPASDIDVALVHAPPASAPQLLLALHALLQGRPHVAGAQLLPHAQVPILKLKLLVAAADGHLALVDFDVSVCAGSDEHHQGLAAVGPVRASLRELPALRALTVCVKHFLAVLGLNQTYTGGLCAHAVLLLVRAYLLEQARGARASEAPAADAAAWASAQEADPDLGEALVGFFAFFAKFDFAHTHVCWAEHASAEPVFRQRPPLAAARGYPPPPTMIDAVQNAAINVGAKAFAIATVSQAFARAADELTCCAPLAAPGVFFSLLRLGSGAGSGVLLPPPPPPHAARRLLLDAPQPQPQVDAAAPHVALKALAAPVETRAPLADEGAAHEAEAEAEAEAAHANADDAARQPAAAVDASAAAEASASAAAAAAAAAAVGEPGDGMTAADGAPAAGTVATVAARCGRKPRKRNGGGGGEAARATAADGASAGSSLAEWQALYEGLVACVRERLDSLVAASAERERAHGAELRAIKQVVEKQLRSANELEEVLREQAGQITRDVCRYSREFIDIRLEHVHRTMLAAHAASAVVVTAD